MHNKIDFANYRLLTLGLATSATLGIMYTLPSQATAFSFTCISNGYRAAYGTKAIQ